MRTIQNPTMALALILATALFASTPGLHAQQTAPPAQQPPDQQQQPPPDQPPPPPDQQQQPGRAQQPDQPQPDQQGRSFQGKIVKLQNGQFALLTGQTPDGKMAGHFLDDQNGAKKYEGKQVTVTGTLEEASNTIHVDKIETA